MRTSVVNRKCGGVLCVVVSVPVGASCIGGTEKETTTAKAERRTPRSRQQSSRKNRVRTHRFWSGGSLVSSPELTVPPERDWLSVCVSCVDWVRCLPLIVCVSCVVLSVLAGGDPGHRRAHARANSLYRGPSRLLARHLRRVGRRQHGIQVLHLTSVSMSRTQRLS